MAGSARWNVLPLLGMREAEAMEEHCLRGTSHTCRESGTTREAGDGRRMARSVDTPRA